MALSEGVHFDTKSLTYDVNIPSFNGIVEAKENNGCVDYLKINQMKTLESKDLERGGDQCSRASIALYHTADFTKDISHKSRLCDATLLSRFEGSIHSNAISALETETASPKMDEVPQHRYGEEGCEWMEVNHRTLIRSNSIDSDTIEIPGVVFSELSIDNLRLHQQAAAVTHAKKKLLEQFTPVPEEWDVNNQNNILPVNNNKQMKKIDQASSNIYIFEPRVECATGILIAALWCAQLLLSLSATALRSTMHRAWVVVYVAGSMALLVSLLILNRRARPKQQGFSQVKIEVARAQSNNVILCFLAEVVCGSAALLCLAMHSISLSICRGNTSAEWFLTQQDRIAICDDTASPKLVPLVIIESVLLLAAVFRIFLLLTLKLKGQKVGQGASVRENCDVVIAH